MSREAGHFSRILGRRDVLVLAFGAMIGWGWVALAGSWIQSAGSVGTLVAFAAGGLAVVLIGLTYAELAAAMPITGGEHVYSYRALGVIGSFLCTWALLLGYVSVVAFEAVALPTVLEYLLPDYKTGYLWTVAGWDVYASWVAVGIGGSLLMMAINYVGIRTAVRLQGLVTLLIAVAGLMLMGSAAIGGEGANMQPLLVDSGAGIVGVMVMLPMMFVGFDVIPQAAEEIDLPQREIGRVLLLAVLMAVAWYSFITLSVSVALDSGSLADSELAVADAMAALVGGSWGGKLIVLAGIGGILTSWNAFYVGGSRAIFAMARARMLPEVFARLHPRFNTPANAILLIGALSLLAPLAGRKAMVWLVDAGSLGIVVAYGLVALSFLLLRRKAADMPRPFRVHYGMLVGSLALLVSVGLACLYLPGSPAALTPEEWLIVLTWSLLGWLLYRVARRRHSRREMAAVLDAELRSGHSDS